VSKLSAEDALGIWQEKGLLSREKAGELKNALKGVQAHDGIGKGITIFATIGVVLVGLGILLFIGSNWKNMGPAQRMLTVFAVYIITALGAFSSQKRGYEKVSESLWFLCSLMLGGGIFLLAQIFNYSLTYWQGPFLWMIGILAMGFARRKQAYAAAAVPLGILALGWLGGGEGWFMDDEMGFLFSDRGLKPILPLMGIALISLGTVVRERVDWMEQSFFKWGALLAAVPLIASTVDEWILKDVFSAAFTLKQAVIICLAFVVVVLAVMKGKLRSDMSRYALIASAILLFAPVIHVGGEPYLGRLVSEQILVFVAFIIAVFALFLLSVWFGVQTSNRNLVNAGVLGSSVVILIQYFSWSFEMLNSSIAFILGGLVLIALSVFMERTRRKLLFSMK